jgi:hypothetical protein
VWRGILQTKSQSYLVVYQREITVAKTRNLTVKINAFVVSKPGIVAFLIEASREMMIIFNHDDVKLPWIWLVPFT